MPNVQDQKIHFVGSRRSNFGIFEFGDHSTFSANMYKSDKRSDLQTTMAQSDKCISADAFLLCFSISSRSSLFNAMKYWVPSLTATSPTTPIVLVGCKSDMRIVHSLAHACVSSQQALAMSKQSGAVMYVETSAKLSNRSTNSAFEVAALACLGHLTRKSSLSVTTSVFYSSAKDDKPAKQRDISEPRSRLSRINPCDIYASNLSLNSKSSTLSSTKSDSSISSITTTKTPMKSRRSGKKVKNEETIVIKCQRLNSHKEVEEVEIEVPANVYNNIQKQSDTESNLVRNSKERRSLGSKLRRLILKD